MKPEIKKRIEQIRCGEVPEGYRKTKVGIASAEWEETYFREMFSRLNRKNVEGNTNVLTISAQHGLISQEDFFNKSIASEDKSNYFLLYKGEYAYNKSYSNGYPFGALKSLELYESGIVSPLYICFAKTDRNKCPQYYTQYFEGGLMNSEIKALAQEGARNHGLLNISVNDFFNSYLLVPPLPEQQKIAAILTTQDKVIALQKKMIEELQKFKRACLQKMFPKKGETVPEVRFPGFTDAWEKRKLGEITDSYSGGTPSVGVKEYYGGDIPFIRSAEINSDYTELNITQKGLDNSSARITNIGDILYALYGATSGEVGRARLKGAVNQAILVIQPHEEYYPEYLMQWLRKSKQPIIDTYLQGGQGNLSGAIVKDLVIDCPTADEQEVIGTFFHNLDTLITIHQRKLEEMQNMKKALMQLLLTGIVRVKI